MRADVAQQAAHPAQSVRHAHPASGLTWQRRLALIMKAPSQREIQAFIDNEVAGAVKEVSRELTERGRPAEVSRGEETGAVLLTIPAEGVRDFVYGVQLAQHKLPAYSAFEAAQMEVRYEARTFFSDGSQGYDIMGMTREQIIADVLVQFERYLALVQSPDVSLVAAAPEHV